MSLQEYILIINVPRITLFYKYIDNVLMVKSFVSSDFHQSEYSSPEEVINLFHTSDRDRFILKGIYVS